MTWAPGRTSSIKKLADEILAARSVLVLSEDTMGAAKHAAEQGWIKPACLPEVREEKRADEGKDDSKRPAPGGVRPGAGAAPKIFA